MVYIKYDAENVRRDLEALGVQPYRFVDTKGFGPSAELVEQAAALNKELLSNDYLVHPVFHDDEWMGEWKFALVDLGLQTGPLPARVLTEFIVPKHADWHTLYLFGEACRTTWHQAKLVGKAVMLAGQLRQTCSQTGVPVELIVAHL
jgi:hypothetical protein